MSVIPNPHPQIWKMIYSSMEKNKVTKSNVKNGKRKIVKLGKEKKKS